MHPHTQCFPSRNFGEKSIMVLEHPTYSPDLALCDFFLFPTIKNHLKGCGRDPEGYNGHSKHLAGE
jgi:hypothetical protein